jgi:hypothetical protein
MKPPAMKRPGGVVDVRKVKTAGGGEGGRTHITWVIAYSERIEVGSAQLDAIRTFAATLKTPRGMDASIMLLPVVAREAPPADARPPAQPARAPTKARARRPARARAKAAAKPRAKVRAKAPARVQAKRTKRLAKTPAKSNARKPARKPARGRAAARTTRARSKPSA